MNTEHVTVFQENGKFAGWPANHGIWSWGDCILFGFQVGEHADRGFHAVKRGSERNWEAYSSNGGNTWSYGPQEMSQSLMRVKPEHPIAMDALSFMWTGKYDPATRRSWYMHRSDVNFRWEGPFRFPGPPRTPAMLRTDYIISGKHDMHVFVTVPKNEELQEGLVECWRTTDGQTFHRMSQVGAGAPKGYSIMPSSIRLGDGTILTSLRNECHDKKVWWIDIWASKDNGMSWSLWDIVHESPMTKRRRGMSNPPSLIQLNDGRLWLSFGDREAGKIRAGTKRLSDSSWDFRTLDANAGSYDFGYSRDVQRPDGKIVTVYYWHGLDSPYREIRAAITDLQ